MHAVVLELALGQLRYWGSSHALLFVGLQKGIDYLMWKQKALGDHSFGSFTMSIFIFGFELDLKGSWQSST